MNNQQKQTIKGKITRTWWMNLNEFSKDNGNNYALFINRARQIADDTDVIIYHKFGKIVIYIELQTDY